MIFGGLDYDSASNTMFKLIRFLRLLIKNPHRHVFFTHAHSRNGETIQMKFCILNPWLDVWIKRHPNCYRGLRGRGANFHFSD